MATEIQRIRQADQVAQQAEYDGYIARMIGSGYAEPATDHQGCTLNRAGNHMGNLYCPFHGKRVIRL